MPNNRIFLAATFAAIAALSAARTPVNNALSPLDEGYRQRAIEYEGRDLNAATIDQLSRLVAQTEASSLTPADQWLLIKACYERGYEDTPALLTRFIDRYPDAPDAAEARMMLGDWYFFNGEYGAAAVAYEKCDIAAFTPGARATYTYRYALSLIKAGDIERGEQLMAKLRTDRRYANEARYYLGYVAYCRGDYKKATELFNESRLDASYYLAQIDFREGKYEEVARRGETLAVNPPDASFIPEIRRITGESLFNLGDMEGAERYLEAYISDKAADHNNSAVYDLGVIRYDNGDYEGAAKLFSRLTDERDAIGQSANLFMGQCEMMHGNDNGAAIYFRNAYERNFDNAVAETAFYNYLTSVTRGGNVPFASAAGMCEEFLRLYPKSKYADAVDEYLVTAYYNEKDYAKALKSIERISNPSAAVLAAKQKVLYELGVGDLSNGNPRSAETYLGQCAAMHDCDRRLALEAGLWLGDALFRQGKYGEAAKEYEVYISKAHKDANRSLALYDLAYATYKQGKYAAAAKDFANALAASPALPKNLADDARIRRADCLYYTADYKGARDAYSKAIADGAAEADYATYRRAVIYGLLGDRNAKIKELSELPARYPASRWKSTALLEKALSLQNDGRTDDAIVTYDQLLSSYPDAPETRRGMLQMASALGKSGKTARATEIYKDIISRWPTSEEAVLANNDLRRIAAADGTLAEYASFIRSIPNAPAVDDSELDKIAFEAAEIALLEKGSTEPLERYVADFGNGGYLAQALYDLGDVAAEKGDNETAMKWLGQLLERRPDSRMATAGMALAAEICEDEGKHAEALSYWRRLLDAKDGDFAEDAMAGIMRLTPNAAEQLKYAREILKEGARDPQRREEAMLYEGLALIKTGDGAAAEALAKVFADGYKSEPAARAAVELAQHYLDSGQTQKALDVLDKFTDEGTPHQYWLARGFIALADAYKASGNTSLAKQYISMMKQNYPGGEEEIRRMIETRENAWN